MVGLRQPTFLHLAFHGGRLFSRKTFSEILESNRLVAEKGAVDSQLSPLLRQFPELIILGERVNLAKVGIVQRLHTHGVQCAK